MPGKTGETGPAISLRFLPPGSQAWQGSRPGNLPLDPSSSDLEDALRGLHAMGVSLALDAEIRSSGKRTLSLSVAREDLPIVQRFLLPVYRGWSWTPHPSLPPATSWKRGWVAELHPLARLVEGPYPRPDPRTLPRWTPWEGFLRVPPQKGWNGWMRVWITPSGRSYSIPLPWAPETELRPPPHAIGRRILDQQFERQVEMRWSVGGLMLIWADDPGAVNGRESEPPERFPDRLRSLVTGPMGSRSRGPKGFHPDRFSRLVEAFSTCAGGEGFTLAPVRTSWGRHRAAARHFASRGPGTPRGGPGRRGYLSPPETVMWMPPTRLREPWLLSPGERVKGKGLRLGTDPVGVPVELTLSSTEGHHLLVAGETGMGKSSLLIHMASQALAEGTALVVLDPLGETVRDLLENLPRKRLGSALLLAPHASPVGLNALAPPAVVDPTQAGIERERMVGELVTAFRRVRAERFGETFYWGPRIEELLTQVLSFLSYVPGATLHEAVALLTDPGGVHLPFEQDPENARRMQELLTDLQTQKREDMEGARRVVGEVTLSPSLSRMLACPTPRWDLSRALEPGSVTCISMERSALGARASSYLGSILLSLFLSRLAARGERRSKVILVLDEVQEYANGSLTEMLRMGRRYNLHLWAATQSISALPPELRESLLTNVRDLLLFRGSPSDAKLVCEHLGLEEGKDLLALPRGRARVFLEKASRVTTITVPPPAPSLPPHSRHSHLELVLERSRPLWIAGSVRGPKEPDPPAEVTAKGSPAGAELLLYALLAGSLALEEGEDFPVSLRDVEAMAGGDRKVVRRVGSLLKGRGALVRSETAGGDRRWVLTRHGIEAACPEPWSPELLAQGAELWKRGGRGNEPPREP